MRRLHRERFGKPRLPVPSPAQQPPAADCLQRPLRVRFRQRLRRGVRSPESFEERLAKASLQERVDFLVSRQCTGRQHMSTASPEEVVQAFYRAFNNGDIETIVTLYEPRAILVAQPGQLVEGLAALREALREFLAMKPTLCARRWPKPPPLRAPMAFGRGGQRRMRSRQVMVTWHR